MQNSDQAKILNEKFDKKEFLNLSFVLLAALILRLIFIFELQGTPFAENLFSDSEIYNNWAKEIVQNGAWIGDEVFFMAPVYPYFLAFVYLIFGLSAVFAVKIIQVLISTITVYFIYLIGRQFHSKAVGFTGAIIASIYSIFIFYSGLILSETLQAFFITLLGYLIIRNQNNTNLKNWFWIGIVLGISAIIRGNIIIFLLAAVIYLIVKSFKNEDKKIAFRKAIVFLVLGTALPILVTTVRNYAVSDDFVPITSNGGINFYLGNNEDSPGVFVTPDEFDFHDDLSGHKYAESQTGRALKPSEVSNYWYSKGFDFIFSHPGDALLLQINKLFLFFGEDENPQSSFMDIGWYEKKYSDLLKLPLPDFLFVSLLFLIGITFAFSKKREHALFYIFILTFIVATIIFFVNGRYRLAITPLMIVISSYGIKELFEVFKTQKLEFLKKPVLVAGIFLIGYYFGITNPKFTDYDAYMHLGDIAFDNENFAEAADNYNRSLFFRDYHVTYMKLGNAFARMKNFDNAFMSYQRAIQRKKDYVKAYFNMGTAYIQSEQMNKAVETLNKVLEIDSTFADAYRNLGIIYYINQNFEGALEYFNNYLRYSDDEETKKTVRQDINNIKSKLGIKN